MSQAKSEWLSLPSGFHDYSEKDFLVFLRKSNAFIEIAHELNAEIVVTPPLGEYIYSRHLSSQTQF